MAAEGIAGVDTLELPLHSLHVDAGARMAAFAGWLMPIHYPLGILGEHRQTRGSAALFDVSHMGQIRLRARSGELRDAALALERLVPVDLLALRPGRQRYALLTTASGGVIDDLMIANLGSCLYLVVNAARVSEDLAHLERHLSDVCHVEHLTDRVLLALQGPKAVDSLVELLPQAGGMRFMDAVSVEHDGAPCVVTRSGYTGEDGFEISLPADRAASWVAQLLANPLVRWAGLGARDSLRLEAGLCLYGHELTAETTPVEASLAWAIQPSRRTGGARAGGYPGDTVISSQLSQGTTRRRVGLRPVGRPVREGAWLFDVASGGEPVGQVTSGTFAPSAQCPIAMGYVPVSLAAPGGLLHAEVRGQRVPVHVSDMPFVPPRYHR
jgi:aminomethyltransferase